MTQGFSFSPNSQAKLDSCHPLLQQLAKWAIQYYDFSVVAGYRDQLTQDRYFASGVSKVQWPHSKHNTLPSLAFDLYPYHSRYGSLTEDQIVIERICELANCMPHFAKAFIQQEYCIMAQTILVGSKILGIGIRWGGDWDSDTDRLDQTFHDLAHFELRAQ